MLAGDTSTVVPEVLAALKANVDIQNAVKVTVGDAVTQLVGDAALWQGLGEALGGAVTTLVDDTAVQYYAGTMVGAWVTTKLGDSPGRPGRSGRSAPPCGSCWPSQGGAGSGCVDRRGVAEFPGPERGGCGARRGGRALAAAMLAGDTSTVLPEVLAALKANVDIQNAVKVTVGDAVTQLVGDAALWQGLGEALGGLVTRLVDNTTVQQYAANEIAAPVTAKLGDSPRSPGRSVRRSVRRWRP